MDDLLNGRQATDWEQAVVAGLLAEYPRDAVPVPRPVTDAPLPVLP